MMEDNISEKLEFPGEGFEEEEISVTASSEQNSQRNSLYGIAISRDDQPYSPTSEDKKPSSSCSFPKLYAEDNEMFDFFPFPYEGETAEEETFSTSTESSGSVKVILPTPQHRKRSLFAHSSPMHFPDVHRAKKSAFGSIFLRTTARAHEEILLKSVAESNYRMLQSMLESLERILLDTTLESERKQIILAYKETVIKALEAHGVSRKGSDGSEQWDIYPVTKSYLFFVQIGDHMHQTRALYKIEDRLVNGLVQTIKDPFYWATGSIWNGHWDMLGMAGPGTFVMPHGVVYEGKMVDGMFHDDNATLTYPNNFKALHCVYNKGKLISCDFQFPDGLDHLTEGWSYCQSPDRRFCSEIRNNLKPAKIAQKTEIDPSRKIPPGCYDTNDGFYNPKTLMLNSPLGDLLRVPVCKEDAWIKKFCRKGFPQPSDFRPDLYDNWYDQKTIQEVLKAQRLYRKGKLNYDELQQIYANLDILPSWSKYKKVKTGSQTEMEQTMKAIPEPKLLKPPRKVKKYEGHKFPQEIFEAFADLNDMTEPERVCSWIEKERKSRGSLRHQRSIRERTSVAAASMQTSRAVSSRGSTAAQTQKSSIHSSDSSQEQVKRKIPESFLKPTPILRPPFQMRMERKKKCEKKVSSESVSEVNVENLMMHKMAKKLILDIINKIVLEERERHRKRFLWGRKLPQISRKKNNTNEKCLKVLQNLFDSIPTREEYCDSDPTKTHDLKKLAEDKYQMLKFWGRRLYILEFDDHKHHVK